MWHFLHNLLTNFKQKTFWCRWGMLTWHNQWICSHWSKLRLSPSPDLLLLSFILIVFSFVDDTKHLRSRSFVICSHVLVSLFLVHFPLNNFYDFPFHRTHFVGCEGAWAATAFSIINYELFSVEKRAYWMSAI